MCLPFVARHVHLRLVALSLHLRQERRGVVDGELRRVELLLRVVDVLFALDESLFSNDFHVFFDLSVVVRFVEPRCRRDCEEDVVERLRGVSVDVHFLVVVEFVHHTPKGIAS